MTETHRIDAADHDGLNTPGIMQAVGIAFYNMHKLEDGQKQDLINAGLDILQTIIVDDLTHAALENAESAEHVASRVERLCDDIETVRQSKLDRFFNLCELLNPEIDLACEVSHREVRSNTAAEAAE